jgi:hypothetical protein
MNNNIWTYFSALGSVAFGWLLNEMGNFLKTRREDKRIKRKVLFFLFETLYTFKKLDISKELELITEKIILKLPAEAQTDEGRHYLRTMYNPIISNLVENDVSENLLELEESYKKSIEELSLVDPISAYRLKGKNRILQTFDQLYDYFEDVKQQFPEESNDIESQSEKVFEQIKPELLNNSISDLEVEIKSISLSIGIWTRIKANKILNQSTNKEIDIKRNKQIDELLDKLMPKQVAFGLEMS